MRCPPRILSNRGITIMELMITMLIGSLVTTAAVQFYISQHHHVIQQRDVSDVQQNLRASMQEITDNVRMAGYGMPTWLDPIVASDTNPDSIQLFYMNRPTGRASIEHPMPNTSAELRLDGHDLSAFTDGMWAYIYDPATEVGEFFLMTKVQYAAQHIQHNTMPLSQAYPRGSIVIAVESYKYYVDNSDTLNPVLIRDRLGEGPQVFSESINDLQFSYHLADGSWSNAPPFGRLIRAVNVNVDAVGNVDEHGVLQGERRTRSLTARVKIRNLGL